MAKGNRVYYGGTVEVEGGSGSVGTWDEKRGQRHHLTEAALRRLTRFQRPKVDPATGRTRLVEWDGTPYRFLLAQPGDVTPGVRGLAGFGVYVGKTRTSYEVQVGDGQGGVKRVTLGSVLEMTMVEAEDKARKYRKAIQGSADLPGVEEAKKRQELAARQMTVRGCMNLYIQDMRQRFSNGEVEENSVLAVEASLRRIERPKVGLAAMEVRNLFKVATKTDEHGNVLEQGEHPLVTAWKACRVECMKLSNQLTGEQKKKLEAAGEWWTLSAEEIEAMGIRGRFIQRALSSGLAATEHTFGDVKRAIDIFIQSEAFEAAQQGREPALTVNPTIVLTKAGYFRDQSKLRAHYRKARTRNPLGAAQDDQSLQTIMKAMLQRRDHDLDEPQKVGVDYLFLVLLWGLRRNEGTVLRWYDDCSPAMLASEEVSWVWLAPNPNELNPHTRLRGSQVFLHATKAGVPQHIPVCYFANRILQWRWDARLETLANHEKLLKKAQDELKAAQARTIDESRLAKYRKAIRRVEFQRANVGWVFPARTVRAKDGHYKDSKSLLKILRQDVGRLDLSKDIDVGLTVHDFRRTMGRFASKLLSGRMVSQVMRHTQGRGTDGSDTMEYNTEAYYTDQEWPDIQTAYATVEEAMIRTSPRVWNRLKGPDKPVLDEANDPPVVLANYQPMTGGEEEE